MVQAEPNQQRSREISPGFIYKQPQQRFFFKETDVKASVDKLPSIPKPPNYIQGLLVV